MPFPNRTFTSNKTRGIKLLSRLRLGLSHLRDQKLSFQDTLNYFCSCGKGEVETSSHSLLHCSNCSQEQLDFLNIIKNMDKSILQQSDTKFTNALLFSHITIQQSLIC